MSLEELFSLRTAYKLQKTISVAYNEKILNDILASMPVYSHSLDVASRRPRAIRMAVHVQAPLASC